MFQVFSKLARQYPTTHFLRLSAQYAEDMPSSALPAVLAYRRGELISNLVHFAEELDPGSEITIPTVEAFLIRYPSYPLSSPKVELTVCREDILPGEEPESDTSV
jgi:Phosducin